VDNPAEQSSKKPRDFRSSAVYERRVVAFYDVLGWRSKIAEAGEDLEKLKVLQQIVLMHSRVIRIPKSTFPSEVSTFSDNVVISVRASEYTPLFMQQLAILQACSTMLGFLIRGGVTIGNLIHNDEVVFGPALNRAYELESKVAKYPRIVLDPDALTELQLTPHLMGYENGVSFLDPFTTRFLGFISALPRDPKFETAAVEAGIPRPSADLSGLSGLSALKTVAQVMKVQLRSPLEDDQYEKVAWLFDRIAKRLGVPPAGSYPRTRPNYVAE